MADDINYWRGVIATPDQLSRYKVLWEKFRNRAHKSTGYENLSRNRHSARVNDEIRIGMVTVELNGQPYLMVLKELEHHEYDKFDALDVQLAIIKLLASLGQTITIMKFGQDDDPDKDKVNQEPAIPINYFNKRFIFLNEKQTEVTQSPLPLIVSGGPGSGKSCVAFAMLEQQARLLNPGERLLYITSSKYLANAMRALWAASPGSEGLIDCVDFMSYEEYALKQDATLKDKVKVDEEAFTKWLTDIHFKNEMNKLKSKRQKTGLLISIFSDPNLVYQELRLLSGYSREGYLALSKGQCIFSGENAEQTKVIRTYMYDAYERYQKYLDQNKQWNPAFNVLPTPKQPPYKQVICDEAQDLSGRQLLSIQPLAFENNSVWCWGDHQILNDNLPQQAYLNNMLTTAGCKPTNFVLPGSYRCPAAALDMANEIISMKYELTGGLSDKKELPQITITEEQRNNDKKVCWINSKDHPDFEKLKAKKGTNFAVITLPAYVAEAKELYDTDLVFTPEEIKGLEYETVLIHRLFDDKVYKEANRSISKIRPEKTGPINCPKSGKGDPRYASPFNRIFTAITRVTGDLIIFQPEEDNKLGNITSRLQTVINPKAEIQPLTAIISAPSDTQIWKEEAQRLSEQGNIKQAEAINKRFNLTTQSDKLPDTSGSLKIVQRATVTKKGKKKAVQSAVKPDVQATQAAEERRVNNMFLTAASITPYWDIFFDSPQFEHYFFEVQVASGLTVLENILAYDDNFASFYQWLSVPKNSNYLKKISCAILEKRVSAYLVGIGYDPNDSPLQWLFKNENGRRLFALLLNKNEKTFKDLSAKALCLPYTDKALKYAGISPLLSMIKTDFDVFQSLVKLNKKLMKQIKAADFCKQLPENECNNEYAGKSAFYYAAHDIKDENIQWLINQKPDLIKEISSSAFYKHVYAWESVSFGLSSFYWLCTTVKKRDILKRIFRENPKLLNDLTIEILLAWSDNYCPLFELAKDPELLEIIFNAHPDFKKNISIERMFCKHEDYTGSYNGLSLIGALAVLPDNIKLVTELLNNATNWDFQNMKGDTILHRAVKENNYNLVKCLLESKRPFNELINVRNNKGQSPLDLALSHGLPHITRLLQGEVNTAYTNDLEQLNTPFPDLIGNAFKETDDTGRPQIISDILSSNGHIRLEAMQQLHCLLFMARADELTRKLDNAIIKRDSILFWISLIAQTRNFCFIPGVVKKMNAKGLCRPVNINSNEKNISALYNILSVTNFEQEIVNLLTINPDAMRGVTGRELCHMVTKNNERYSSCLYLLSWRVELYARLIELNPRLAEDITPQAFFSFDSTKSSSFNNLCFTPAGCKIVNNIFTNNHSLYYSIQPDHLCLVEKSVNTTSGIEVECISGSFFNLINIDAGLEILSNIFRVRPELAAKIPVESLFLTESGAGCLAVTLCYVKNGREILMQIFHSQTPQKNKDGDSWLHLAVKTNCILLVVIILAFDKYEAMLSEVNNEGLTPLDLDCNPEIKQVLATKMQLLLSEQTASPVESFGFFNTKPENKGLIEHPKCRYPGFI